MAKTKLSISLIKTGITNLADMVRVNDCTHKELPGIGHFYYNNSRPKDPDWLQNFFLGQLGEEPKLKTSFVQALLIIKRNYQDETRYFAIAFGYGRNLLIPGAIEPRFGLKTTLNTIDPKQLRSLDKNSLEAIPTKGRVQSSKLSELEVFNLDTERDILRSITAKTLSDKKDDFGGTISGSDTLHFSQEVDIDTINDLLDKCYEQYKSEAYKQRFEWIDHLEPIKEPGLISTLDDSLIGTINNRNLEAVWMAAPELLRWEDQLTFHLGGRRQDSDDLDIEQVLVLIFDDRRDLTIKELKDKHVKVKDANGVKVSEWSYYRCLYGEVNQAGSLYLLNEGEWFKVDDNYNQQILEYYNNATISPKQLIDCNKAESEGDYNQRLANSDPSYCLMDKQLVKTGIPQNEIEVCDVLTQDKYLIHVKKGHGSSVLSHLFNQGFVSGTMLLQQQFRKETNKKMKADVIHGKPDQANWLFTENKDYIPGQYTIVFGIITGKNVARPRIPFFSKVVFRQIATTLSNQGYSVCLANIAYSRPAGNP